MRRIASLLLVVFLSFLPLVSIFATPDLPHTHDGGVHLPRMAAYFKALADGHILPRWTGELNYGYGLPLFNFIYHTPYLISSLFISLGLSLVTTFKLVISISYILAGVFMYLFTKAFFKNEKIAFLVTIFYQFAPFRLVELLIRGSFGELYTYTFLPLALWGITKFFSDGRVLFLILSSIATGLLIVSHNSISLMFFGVLILFITFFSPNKRVFLFCTLSLFVGLLLSSFYWLPAMAEHKYTYGDLFMKDTFRDHFPPFLQLIVPNVLNEPSLRTGNVPMQIGIFHLLSILLALLFLLNKKIIRDRKVFTFVVIITSAGLFLMTPLSLPIWERVSFLRQFQFPWRLLSLIAVASSLAAVSFFSFRFFKKQWAYGLLVLLVVVSTAGFWKPAEGFDKISDETQFWNYPLNTTYFGETDVIWSAGPAYSYPKSPVEVIDGNAIISQLHKKTQLHFYSIDAKDEVRLVDHTQYFPGWRVYVDGKKVPIQFQDPSWRGEITYKAPKGIHSIRVAFEETPLRAAADLVSLATLFVLSLSYMFWRKKKLS